MTLDEILADKNLAIHKKKSEIQKSDYSNVVFDSIQKAYNTGIQKLEVLVYESIIKRERNEEMFKNYLNGYVLNHSVGMRYVKLLFCYDNPEYSQEKENYDKYSEMILNKDDLGEYFWAVIEAKNIEGSAVVKGSNFLTPVLSMEVIDENTIKVKSAISPSNILDSHRDVHIPKLWNQSLNQNQYDLLIQEHDMDFKSIIVDSISGSLKVYTEMIPVKELMSKFSNKNIEQASTTQKQEAGKATSRRSVSLLLT